jgi:glycerol-3-phosphate dehydrogenase (NAD(P)+)
MIRHCTVLGAGSFGTALAVQLARRGHTVRLWDRNASRCASMNQDRRNPRYLKDIELPEGLVATPDLAAACRGSEMVVVSVPSHAVRDVVSAARDHIAVGTQICCASKGIEAGSLDTMHEVLSEVLGLAHQPQVTILSGPTFALELAQGMPTTIVAAGEDPATHAVAEAFHGGGLRVYHTHDVIGVCLGGALKNVVAIACGISDGLGIGLNARAGIITRGLAEIRRLAETLGAEPITMMGLAGMGDLVLTCTGNLSRNRRVGLALGEGRTLQDILDELGEVAEGVKTARTAHELARLHDVEMPITEQVHQVIYEGQSARDALAELMGRARKHDQH